MSQKRFHEEWAIVASIPPEDGNNADRTSDVIDMSKFSELAFLVQTGTVAASGTCTVTVKEDSASAFSSGTAISGKTISITASDDDEEWIITLLDEELSAGERYVRLEFDNSAHSQLLSAIVLGRSKYQPATDHDLSSVNTVVD